MKSFTADWKNPALLGAAIIIVLLTIFLVRAQSSSLTTRMVRVGNTIITRQDFLNEVRRKGGNELFLNMIGNALIDNYARVQNITVADDELAQMLRIDKISAEMSGQTLEEYLAAKGATVAQLQQERTIEILRAKLVVPTEDVKKAFPAYQKRKEPPFTMPPIYRYRRVVTKDKDDAMKAIDILKQGEKLKDNLATVAQPGSEVVVTTLPGFSQELPDLLDVLVTMKKDEISKPFQITIDQSIKPWVVLQLVDFQPEEKPTLENCSVHIALDLMRTSPKYEKALADLTANALQKVEVYFSTEDFPEVNAQVRKIKMENFPIPGVTGNGAPGAPGVIPPAPGGTVPAPPPPAGGQ